MINKFFFIIISLLFPFITLDAVADKFFIGYSLNLQKDKYINTAYDIKIKAYEEKRGSSINPSASIMAGNIFDINNFHFMTEVGVDVGDIKINSTKASNTEVKSLYHLYLSQKIGYKFMQSFSTYISLGFGLKDVKVELASSNLSSNKLQMNYILGVGGEYRINLKISVFTELNYHTSRGNIYLNDNLLLNEINLISVQIKVGSRYYF